ncbi:N-formylglutamate amidohydrolase [Palleronia sediminis]|uniref:N-formylglutamate amidohydrolase n=2 Tax=Palleronia sediminis TaxID=2547833 RepID=A0A4R6A1H2_9RHOB|nr:N-formylglutamate amidohydrolase [Palleronia sediminis]
MDESFDLRLPRRRDTPFVFASPHSGRDYPAELLRESVLSPAALRSSEDAFIDRLFDAVPDFGAPLLSARLPRAWVDMNRAADELDPALIEGQRRGPHNPRIASGLGVVPRVVSGGRSIYRGKIGIEAARARIRQTWRPYHDALAGLIRDSRAHFGQAILIDCHSMPHEALDHVRVKGRRPDVVLGDRFGASADPDIVNAVEEVIAGAGLVVSRNAPFAGAFIAQHYGKPARGQHVIQIEFDRRLYMDEATLIPHEGYGTLKAAIDEIVARLCDLGRVGDSLAAE